MQKSAQAPGVLRAATRHFHPEQRHLQLRSPLWYQHFTLSSNG